VATTKSNINGENNGNQPIDNSESNVPRMTGLPQYLMSISNNAMA
jgi:hypothetical protein